MKLPSAEGPPATRESEIRELGQLDGQPQQVADALVEVAASAFRSDAVSLWSIGTEEATMLSRFPDANVDRHLAGGDIPQVLARLRAGEVIQVTDADDTRFGVWLRRVGSSRAVLVPVNTINEQHFAAVMSWKELDQFPSEAFTNRIRDFADRAALVLLRSRVRESRDVSLLELHDDVLQSLLTARVCLDEGETDDVRRLLDEALEATRRVMETIARDLGPGQLRRSA